MQKPIYRFRGAYSHHRRSAAQKPSCTTMDLHTSRGSSLLPIVRRQSVGSKRPTEGIHPNLTEQHTARTRPLKRRELPEKCLLAGSSGVACGGGNADEHDNPGRAQFSECPSAARILDPKAKLHTGLLSATGGSTPHRWSSKLPNEAADNDCAEEWGGDAGGDSGGGGAPTEPRATMELQRRRPGPPHRATASTAMRPSAEAPRRRHHPRPRASYLALPRLRPCRHAVR